MEHTLSRYLSAIETSSRSGDTASGDSGLPTLDMDLDNDWLQEPAPFADGGYYRFVGEHGYERFYGFSSMFSLYAETQSACRHLASSLSTYEADTSQPTGDSLERMNACLSTLRLRLTEADALFERLSQDSTMLQDPDHIDNPPSLPPRALLEVFADTYFTEISPLLPIFDRTSVMAAMEKQYESDIDPPDPAWITSFNYILLQTLSSKLSASKKSGLITRSTIEDSLITNLLTNARRCYYCFEKLLQPRLANVQALLSLALTALKYFRFPMFESVFAQACQLSKAIGLHQRTDGPNERERQDLFWSLFIVDVSGP
ncbi:hypothetical protein BJX96DRAFT_172336 [Aspergillus floccosus]